MANLLHSKGSRTQIYKTLPSNSIGNDGDIILVQIQGKGVYLCSKVNGRWHVSTKMEELRKIEKTSVKDLKVDRLKIGNSTITNHIADFGNKALGFTQFEPTYNATDTDVYFSRNGNKSFITFGSGNITDLNLYFPNVSCSCLLLLKQDGSGSRTVTNWKTFDHADGNESTVLWAGGSAPTLTTAGGKVDMISIYWNNDRSKAYGSATLNF
tara:strand:- start:759 stop:1391 length:633 start_codon:yes stop_codon:yes gene_type:complete